MKTAVSIPDDVFADAEQLARRLKTSRSELYSRALQEYVARHSPDRITEKLDSLFAEAKATESEGDFATRAASRILEQTEW